MTELRRAIRFWEVVALVVNAVIGAGIFGLPSKLFHVAGAWSIAGLAICAVLVTLLNLSLVELCRRFTATGGPYVYAATAYGQHVGFVIGWLTWLMRATAMAAILMVFCDYLARFVPAVASGPARAALVIGVVFVVTAVNIAGVRKAAAVSNLFAVGKLVPLCALAVVGLWWIGPGKVLPTGPAVPGELSRAAMLCVFAFTGFETATILAGEMRDPRRDLPIAVLATTGLVTVVYGLLLIVCIGTLPGLGSSSRPLADAAAVVGGAPAASVMTAAALISVFGSLMAMMTAAPRLLFAMGEAGQLPTVLGTAHAVRRTPDAAVAMTAALVLILALTGGFTSIVVVSTLIRLVSYALTALAVLVLRHRDGDGLWHGPAGIPVFVASLALVCWMVSAVHLSEAVTALVLVAIGLVLRAGTRLLSAGRA